LPALMTVFYWLIPLFVVAVAVAVVPVLYGTLKHEEWEKQEARLKEQQRTRLSASDTSGSPRASEDDVDIALRDAHADAVALLRRIELLTDRVEEGEFGHGGLAGVPGSMAAAGR
jgi:hypothetical protein